MSAQEASCTEGVFTASDGSVLHTVTWRTSVGEGKPRAVIVLVHGYGEHVGRYREARLLPGAGGLRRTRV